MNVISVIAADSVKDTGVRCVALHQESRVEVGNESLGFRCSIDVADIWMELAVGTVFTSGLEGIDLDLSNTESRRVSSERRKFQNGKPWLLLGHRKRFLYLRVCFELV